MNTKTMNNLFFTTSLLILSPSISKAESVYMCEPCPAGYSCNNGVKSPCTAGTFSNAVSTSCSPCTAGTFSNAVSTSCSPCTGNTYSATGASSCSTCASGYTANSSHTGCLKSCRYSYSSEYRSCPNCNGKKECSSAGSKNITSKKGITYWPSQCYCYVYDQSGSPLWFIIVRGCDFNITLTHGDSINGRTCDDGVMR